MHLVMKAEVERPEAETRSTNAARNSLGGRYEMGASRLCSSRSGISLFHVAMAIRSSPRQFLAAPHRR